MLNRKIRKSREIVYVTTLTIIGALFRLFQIGNESIWVDENWSLLLASNEIPRLISLVATLDVHPPTYYILLHEWIAIFGQSEIALRSLSAFFGILAIPLFYILSKKFFDDKNAIIVTFLLTLSSYAIQYSQEARMYTLLLLGSIFSYYAFIRFLENRSRKSKLLYFSSILLLAYTQIMGLTIVAAQGVQFILRSYHGRDRNEILDWIKIQIASALAFLPWLIIVFTQANKLAQKYQPNVGLKQLFGVPFYLSGGWPTFITFGILAAIGSLAHFRRYISDKLNPSWSAIWNKFLVKCSSTDGNLTIALIWFALPLFLQLTFALIIPRSFDYNNFIVSLPALLIIVTYGISEVREYSQERNNGWIYYIVLGLLILSMMISLSNYYNTTQKPEWDEGVSYFESNANTNTVIVFDSRLIQGQFEYYSKNEPYNLYGYPDTHTLIENQKMWPGAEEFQNQTIWFFTSHEKMEDQFISNISQTHVQKTSKSYSGLRIREFSPVQ